MFIGSLYLISVLTTHWPEAITEVCDDYIIININIYRDIKEELQDPVKMVMTSIAEIPPLLPTEDKAEGVKYPYVNLANQSVHIARAHIKQDSKSSEILSFNYFYDVFGFYRRVLSGLNPPFVCI